VIRETVYSLRLQRNCALNRPHLLAESQGGEAVGEKSSTRKEKKFDFGTQKRKGKHDLKNPRLGDYQGHPSKNKL